MSRLDEKAWLNWERRLTDHSEKPWYSVHCVGGRPLSEDEEEYGLEVIASIAGIPRAEFERDDFTPLNEMMEDAVGTDFLTGLSRTECLQLLQHVVDLARYGVGHMTLHPVLICAKPEELRQAQILAAAYRVLLRDEAPVLILQLNQRDIRNSQRSTFEALSLSL